MSKEEIKNLEEIVELAKGEKDIHATLDVIDIKALECLLQEYKELEKENKKLSIIKYEYNGRTENIFLITERMINVIKNTYKIELEDGVFVDIKELYNAYKDSTPNSKIREKIEERKLYLSENDIAYSDDYVLEVLEELLEEK